MMLIVIILKGMLASADTIEMVAQALEDHRVKQLVVDPVRSPFERGASKTNSFSALMCHSHF